MAAARRSSARRTLFRTWCCWTCTCRTDRALRPPSSGDESLVLSEREVTATSAIAFLPKPTPPRVLDSTLRLAVSRAREFAVAKKDALAARGALENRKTIERAKGILMRRTGSSEQEAYRILQRTSQDRSVPMVEIARAVLASEPGFQENQKDNS
jgi:hypothetical protein